MLVCVRLPRVAVGFGVESPFSSFRLMPPANVMSSLTRHSYSAVAMREVECGQARDIEANLRP